MAAVGAADRSPTDKRRDADACAEGDDQQAGAVAARPISVLADRCRDGVVVDDTRLAEAVAEDAGDLDVAEGGQRFRVADDAMRIHRAGGPDADSLYLEVGCGRGDRVGEVGDCLDRRDAGSCRRGDVA
jgi:hypothetical protein